MKEKKARRMVCKTLAAMGCCGVVWHGHFSEQFALVDDERCGSPVEAGKVYSAVMEEYADKYEDGELLRFVLNPDRMTWGSLYKALRERRLAL